MQHVHDGQCGLCTHFGESHSRAEKLVQIRVSHEAPETLIDECGVEKCEREMALCDLFCVEAGRRFRGNRNMLDSKEEEVDETRRSVAAAVREGRGYFVADAILEDED